MAKYLNKEEIMVCVIQSVNILSWFYYSLHAIKVIKTFID